MTTTKLSGGLRLLMVAIVLLAVIVPGYLNRSAWIIVVATPAYTALYALGKWNAWKLAWRLGGVKSILRAILLTLPVQLVLVAILYMIGLGASMLTGANTGIQPQVSGDIMAGVLLFLFTVVIATVINVVEAKAAPAEKRPAGSYALDGSGTFIPDPEIELDIDPTPLTPQTFYVSPGYWKQDAIFDALQGRGETVTKKADAASEEAILAAEQRLGVKLPEGLRDLYKIMDGGYVGWLYVPLKAEPGPFYDDWRGAFSIDYSSLNSLDQLRTVKDHYEDFTDDPDEMPTNADKMVVLQARYQDMTLLDYSDGPEARLRLADFDERLEDSTDIEFPDFDRFFVELRRPKERTRTTGDRLLAHRKKPVAEYMPEQQPSEFWGSGAHAFAKNAASRGDGSEPEKQADDDLVAETEKRLGVTLPPKLVEFWRYRNGGVLAARHFQIDKPGEAYDEVNLPEQLMPMEYFATVAEVSARIVYPDGAVPLAQSITGADKLVFLQARSGDVLLLDYRDGPEPRLILAERFDRDGLKNATRIDSFDHLIARLRNSKPLN